jgi:hypothetical protein
VLARVAKDVDNFVTKGLLGAAKAVRKAAGKGKKRNPAQPYKVYKTHDKQFGTLYRLGRTQQEAQKGTPFYTAADARGYAKKLNASIARHDGRKARRGNLTVNVREVIVKRPKKKNPHTASTRRLSREFHGQEPSGKTVKLHTPPGVPKDVSWCGPVIDIELEGMSKPLEFKNNPKDGDAILGQAQRGSWRRLYIGLKRPYARLSNGQPITRSKSYGTVKAISYWAENGKPHLGEGNKAAPYRHPFENPKPELILTKGGALHLKGGGYTVRAEGIDR